MDHPVAEKIRSAIREVPDFPKPGINFYDITTALKDGKLLRETVDALADRYRTGEVTAVVAIESRGFIYGGALAQTLRAGFVPVRKPGKLPAETERITYELEYGSDTLEIHKDALSPQDSVIIVDDLLATGGTARATIDLVQKLGARVVECACIVELTFLQGRDKVSPIPVVSLVKYST